MALSSAGVVAVYAAGFYRTKAAADRLAEADARRRQPDVPPSLDRPSGPQAAAASEQPVTFTLPTRPAPDRRDEIASRPSIEPPTPSPVNDSGASTTAAARPAVPAPVETSGPVADAPSPPANDVAAVGATQVPADSPAPHPQPAADPKPAAVYKDGTYLGWGTCRHGDIQASVTIAAGRITDAKIAQCWTRYSCNWIDPIVPQVVARQSPNVDYVSGATQSVDAFYWAVVDALSKAK